MRKYVFLFALHLSICLGAYSQTSNVFPASGYVGAGTTSPLSKLHISAPARYNLRMYLDGNTTNYLSLWQGSGGAGIDPIGTGLLYLGYDQSTDVIIGNNGGSLGIGTTPAYPLDVSGSGARIKNNSIATAAYTTFRIQGPNYANGLEIDFFGNNNISTDPNWSYGGGVGSVAIVNVNPKPLTFATNNLGRMIIDALGNVGIGTFNPDQKLTVNGTIHSKEVKVDLSVPAPDYVFEKDYNLPSLEEIKTYIDQNKHLPEVPSAKEMEANGVNLGEMNMLLLKKIEELTLHIIDQNKRIEKLEHKIN